MATIEQVITNANVIKNETATAENTAVRVGTNLVDNAEFVKAESEILGFGSYIDSETSPATQTITTSESKLLIDGAASSSNSLYLPLQIRGISELWDVTNNKINAINIGDGYTMRLDFEIESKSGAPKGIDVILDTGGGATPTIIELERTISVSKIAPYKVSIAFPYFTLSNFKTNGGQIFLKTDSGSVIISNRKISIHRISSGL
tara:strand:- start:579 stop:1193 length:615 start_codon:yes stop_codon:yes gene_type:complete